MNNDMNTASRPGDDDPWQDLAEELFGVEVGKEHKTEESMESASAEPPRAAPPAPPPPVREPEPVFAHREPEPFFGDEDDDGVEDDEFESEPEVTAELVSEDDAEDEVDEAMQPASAAPDPGDKFWDALADWSWDESSERAARSSESQQERKPDRGPRGGGQGRRDESRGRREPSRGRDEPKRRESAPDRPARSSSPPATRSSRAAAPPPVDEFGLGLLGEDPPRAADYPPEDRPARFEEAEQVTDAFSEEETFAADAGVPAEDREPVSDESGAVRKRRRRRRGRRPDADGTAPTENPTVHESKPPAATFEVADEAGDDFGPSDIPEESTEPAADDTASEDGTPRPSRRKRSRRRGRRGEATVDSAPGTPRASDEIPASEPEIPTTLAEADDDDAEEEDDGSIDHVGNYANVPTWEEAISYLLRPSTVQVDPAAAPSGGKRTSTPGEPKKPTRHYGHRRS